MKNNIDLTMRFLTSENRKQLEQLISITEKNLSDKSFWLPIHKTSRAHYLDDKWSRFLGVFDGDKLVAASGLIFNEFEYGESAKKIGISGNGSEITRCMVLPEYRGHNLMLKMNEQLIKTAQEMDLDWALATVHPENVASKTSLEKLGMEQKALIEKCGYPRLLYFIDLGQA